MREPRRPVHLPAAALMEDRSTFTVTVVNLSYDGCRIKCPAKLAPGVTLTISVLGLGKMPANVRWYSDGFAGLSFNPDPIEPPPQTPRQDRRVSLNAEFLLRRSGKKNYYVCTTDVSPSGCSVEFVDRPAVGERHWVKFDGLDGLEAEVRWVSGFKAGLQFVRPIYPAVFELLLARLR
ncbi:MAG: PilZ domain-containing protein [Pseudomonadota bacterium]|nr:PilZ domain-containing protein [Pseudomonadota bacterium]